MEENGDMLTTTGMDPVNQSSPSVVQLSQDMLEYKIGIYFFTYMTVPVAVLGMDWEFSEFQVKAQLI